MSLVKQTLQSESQPNLSKEDKCVILAMSPTVFRFKGYRFFFFSREEERMHVHVTCADGEAKFWMEPVVMLA